MYQALGGCLIEVPTIGELSLEWPKGGRGRLIEVSFPILLHNYYRTLISGRVIEGGLGGHLMYTILIAI